MLSGKPGRLSTNVSIPPLFRPATWTLTRGHKAGSQRSLLDWFLSWNQSVHKPCDWSPVHQEPLWFLIGSGLKMSFYHPTTTLESIIRLLLISDYRPSVSAFILFRYLYIIYIFTEIFRVKFRLKINQRVDDTSHYNTHTHTHTPLHAAKTRPAACFHGNKES